MLQFFCLFHFCILYTVGTCILCNILRVHLHILLCFGSICVFPCLPYFFPCLFALLHCFLSPITHICISCFSAGCCQCRFLDFRDFLSMHFCFCCFHRPYVAFTLLLAASFVCLQFFLMFVFARFVLAFFALRIGGLNKFALTPFRFFWCHRSFFLVPPCV